MEGIKGFINGINRIKNFILVPELRDMTGQICIHGDLFQFQMTANLWPFVEAAGARN